MVTDTEYLADLEKTIRQRYRCSANYRETVFVHEKTADVEIFELTGCKDAESCYPWQCIQNGIRVIAILHSRLVDSAQRAVQAALFSGVQAPRFAQTADQALV